MSEREKQTRFLKELIRSEHCEELETLQAQIIKGRGAMNDVSAQLFG